MSLAINLPNWENDTKIQQENWQNFLKSSLPTRHNERWKYADLSFLLRHDFSLPSYTITEAIKAQVSSLRMPASEATVLVCLNGQFIPELSDLAAIPSEMIVTDFYTALNEHRDLVKKHWTYPSDVKKFPFAELNLKNCNSGLFIYLPKDCAAPLPIQLLSLSTDNHYRANPIHMIVIEHNTLDLIEEYYGINADAYFLNTILAVSLSDNSNLNHQKIQHESKSAFHLSHVFVSAEKDSQYTLTNVSSGAAFARDEIVINLNGQGAACSTAGFYHLKTDHQYIDHHIDVLHSALHTKSEMLYKGIVDKKSRAVFNGRLHVKPGAQKILAYQANHNLLLSNLAEVYSKPELEIYADDVKCKHGSTTGQLNQEALFYLRARGIDYQTAVSILLEGFAEDILNRLAKHTRERLKELT